MALTELTSVTKSVALELAQEIEANNELALSNSQSIESLQASQTGGLLSFTTYALLDAYTPTDATQEKSSYKVTNDSDSSLNGYYHWVSGTVYEKDAELVSNIIEEDNNSEGVSGLAVFNEDTKEVAKSTRYRGRKNLLGPNAKGIVEGFFINSTGAFQANSAYSVTGYISILESETLINNWSNTSTSCQLYDKDFNVLYTSPSGQNYLTWQAGAILARFSKPNEASNTQVQSGSTITSYEVFSQNKPEVLTDSLKLELQNQLNNIKVYENLFDASVAQAGYLNLSGTFVSGGTFDVTTDYIELIEGQNIAFTSGVKLSSPYSVVQYDNEKQIIDASEYPAEVYITGIATAAFVRFTVGAGSAPTTTIKYGVSTIYTPRVAEILPALLFKVQDQIDAQINDVLAVNNRYGIGVNLFNKAATTSGVFIPNSGTGQFNNNSDYEVSDFIRLNEGQQLKATGSDEWSSPFGVYTYDEDKNFLSNHQESTALLTGQVNSYYVRLTNLISKRDEQQYEYGTVATPYQPFQIVLNPIYLPNNLSSPNRIVLPSTVYMKSNATPSIYLDNIAYSPLREPKSITFDKGTVLERQWNFNSRADGNNTVAINYNSNKFDSSYDTIVLNVNDIDETANNGKTVNLMCVGDSFTDIGQWQQEVKVLLEADGVTTNLIGTKGIDSKLSESLSGGRMENFLLNEYDSARNLTVTGVTNKPESGYGKPQYLDSNGTTWTATGGILNAGNGILSFSYDGGGEPASEMPASGTLTKVGGTSDDNVNYSSWVAANRNPYWNNSAPLDFAYYMDFWSFPDPDILALQFTFNDVGNRTSDVTSSVAGAKQIIDAFRAEYTTAKVVFSIEPCGAKFNSERSTDSYLRTFLLFAEAMKVQFEDNAAYNQWVIIAPSYAFVDLVNGYGPSTVTPSSRYPTVTEVYGGDGVHPNETGMKQIADCVVPCIHKLLL
jgi:lysophospholipase L1-like esterase